MEEPSQDSDYGALGAAMDPKTAAAPQQMYRDLRDSAPVIRLGDGVAVSRRADIETVLRDTDTFSSNMSAVDLGNIRPLIPLQIDPPDHVKYRRVLDPLFAPRQVAVLEPQISALVHNLIDRFADQSEVDLASAFTIPLPSEVFLTLLGLPLGDLNIFLAMKDGIIRPPGASMEAQNQVRRATATSIYDYFSRVLEERRSDPRDDLLSRFLVAEADGITLTTDEILDICFLFLIAGLDTVSASLECFFAYLAAHPEERRQLVDDPSLVPSAVEELLRWESPVAGVARKAVRDTELSGEPVRAGDQVFVMIGSGNTDETEVPAAHEVDFHRAVNRHLAFGGGVHRCLGSHLARLELRVAIREFHTRVPEYEIKPGTDLHYTPGIRSIEHLPLVFDRVASR